jgi:hypothetical protein
MATLARAPRGPRAESEPGKAVKLGLSESTFRVECAPCPPAFDAVSACASAFSRRATRQILRAPSQRLPLGTASAGSRVRTAVMRPRRSLFRSPA